MIRKIKPYVAMRFAETPTCTTKEFVKALDNLNDAYCEDYTLAKLASIYAERGILPLTATIKELNESVEYICFE